MLITILIIFASKFLLLFRKQKWQALIAILGLAAVLYLGLPLLKDSLFNKGSERLGTSVFYDEKRNLKRLDLGLASQLSSNLLAHLNPLFFLKGQPELNLRMSMQHFGKMTVFEYLMLVLGLLLLWRYKSPRRIKLFITLWLVFGILPAIIGKEVPHSIRSLNIWPPAILLSAYGILRLKEMLTKFPRYLLFGIAAVYLIQYGLFIREYFYDFPVYAAADWQYGYKEAIAYATKYENEVDKIIITSHYGQPHVFVYVYQNRDPLHVLWGGMGKYQYKAINWDGDKFAINTLLIGTPEEIPDKIQDDLGVQLGEVLYPDGKVAFKIVRIY